MFIVNIIPAPKAKKAISYNPATDELIIHRADVIGLIEISNPESPEEMANLPMYLCADDYGVYFPPQMDPLFLNFIEMEDDIDLSKYTAEIDAIKKLYEAAKTSLEEKPADLVHGKVSFIHNFKKKPVKE